MCYSHRIKSLFHAVKAGIGIMVITAQAEIQIGKFTRYSSYLFIYAAVRKAYIWIKVNHLKLSMCAFLFFLPAVIGK